MAWRKLKLIAKYGMSSNPSAWVVHDIDPNRTGVKAGINLSGKLLVEYRVNFYCGKKFTRPKLMRQVPPGSTRCRACLKARTDPLYWDNLRVYNKARGWKKSHGHKVSLENKAVSTPGSGGEETAVDWVRRGSPDGTEDGKD